MKEEKKIYYYLLWVDEIVNVIRGLGEDIKYSFVVQKVLRSLPSRYNAKISAIEEAIYLSKITVDDLHGILTSYQMRIVGEDTFKREVTFKTTRKEKKEFFE